MCRALKKKVTKISLQEIKRWTDRWKKYPTSIHTSLVIILCDYFFVCVFHIYVFTYFILIESHSGLHLLSMKLLFGNNWTPQIWISYLNFMNNIIVLISLTHPGSSPTRFTCLSEFVCNHSVTLPQKAESFRFHFSTRDTQSPPNTTDCAEIAL